MPTLIKGVVTDKGKWVLGSIDCEDVTVENLRDRWIEYLEWASESSDRRVEICVNVGGVCCSRIYGPELRRAVWR